MQINSFHCGLYGPYCYETLPLVLFCQRSNTAGILFVDKLEHSLDKRCSSVVSAVSSLSVKLITSLMSVFSTGKKKNVMLCGKVPLEKLKVGLPV